MDPYREKLGGCPACGFGLREFGRRQVCDGCGGMMIAQADLRDAVSDLGVLEIDVRMQDATSAKCPGCGGALHRAEIVADKHAIKVAASACARHGVWFDGGELLELLGELGRRAPARSEGGPVSAFVPSWANATGVGGTIARHAPAGHPRVHTPLPSAHADRKLACPECKGALVRSGLAWVCTEHGALVEEIALDAMIGEMTGAPWVRPTWTNRAGARPCPACATAMAIESLDGVEVDCCASDGLWLDPGELETVLARSSERGRKGWLGRLFRRRT